MGNLFLSRILTAEVNPLGVRILTQTGLTGYRGIDDTEGCGCDSRKPIARYFVSYGLERNKSNESNCSECAMGNC